MIGHQPYTEAQFFLPIFNHDKLISIAGYVALSWPRFNIGPVTCKGTTIITVMSLMNDHKIFYCSTHLLALAEIFELGFQT